MTQHPELTLTGNRPFQTQRKDTWWLATSRCLCWIGSIHRLCNLPRF